MSLTQRTISNFSAHLLNFPALKPQTRYNRIFSSLRLRKATHEDVVKAWQLSKVIYPRQIDSHRPSQQWLFGAAPKPRPIGSCRGNFELVTREERKVYAQLMEIQLICFSETRKVVPFLFQLNPTSRLITCLRSVYGICFLSLLTIS